MSSITGSPGWQAQRGGPGQIVHEASLIDDRSRDTTGEIADEFAGLARASQQPLRASLLAPLGAAMSAWAMARVGVLGARQGGLRWRSTFYPAAELLAGRRIRLG